MGGPGSGRWSRWQGSKDTAEGCRRIDIRDWHRRGLLRGRWFTWSWRTRTGEVVASIGVRVHRDRVVLAYRVRVNGGAWQDVEESIALTRTRCPYGGQRPWFVCPRVQCGRRAAVLYMGGPYFLCRHCYDLVYASQREDRMSRQMSRAQKVRLRLGGSASLLEPFPPKPKGMHWRTYARLRWRELAAHEAFLLAMREHIGRFDR
jgi:hypothetical protein